MSNRRRLDRVGAQDAVVRLSDQIQMEARMFPGQPAPSRAQVAMVLHALADHTMIQQAMVFEPDEESPWAMTTSIGRFLHAYGDRFAFAAKEIEE